MNTHSIAPRRPAARASRSSRAGTARASRPSAAGTARPRKTRSLALATLALAAFSSACNESLLPPIFGSITGTVTADGTGLDGVTVSLSNGLSTMTVGGGAYSFANVDEGSYTVTISGFPSDAEFAETSGSTNIAADGQTVVVDFAGTYIRTATIVGSVTVDEAGITGVSVALSGVESMSARDRRRRQLRLLRAARRGLHGRDFRLRRRKVRVRSSQPDRLRRGGRIRQTSASPVR